MFGLGNIPDPPKADGDKPDWDAAELLGAAPITGAASNRDLVTAILNQGGLGSCTANAVAYAIRAAMLLAGIVNPEFASRLFLYYLARSTHGMQSIDSGSYLRAIFEILNKFGFCPESVWSYDDRTMPDTGGFPPKFARFPSHKAFRAAYDQRSPTEYRRIFETGYDRVDQIKRALDARHLIVFGTDVSRPFQQDQHDKGAALPPPVGLEIAGGHALAGAAYDDDGLRGPNSWGEGWGDAGWFYFSWDYMAWEKTRDLWIVRFAPGFSE